MNEDMNYRNKVPRALWTMVVSVWLVLAAPLIWIFLYDPLMMLGSILFAVLYGTFPLYVLAIVCPWVLHPGNEPLSQSEPYEPTGHQLYTYPTAWIIAGMTQALVAVLFVIPRIYGDSALGNSFALGGMPIVLGVSLVPGFAIGLLIGWIVTSCVRDGMGGIGAKPQKAMKQVEEKNGS